MLLAFSWAGNRYEWASIQVLGMLTWATAGLVIFAHVELRTEEPLLPMSLFRNSIFSVSMLVAIIFSLILRDYSTGLRATVPEEVRSEPELMTTLNDPSSS